MKANKKGEIFKTEIFMVAKAIKEGKKNLKVKAKNKFSKLNKLNKK